MVHPFGIVPVHSGALLDVAEIESITGGYLRALEAIGGQRWSVGDCERSDAQLFILVATGGTEHLVLDLWADRRQASPDTILDTIMLVCAEI